jgi:K+-sensing histidine kinase KdpD
LYLLTPPRIKGTCRRIDGPLKILNDRNSGSEFSGLFISKGIIDAHGGSIRAENNQDSKGATFAFSLDFHSDKK